MAYSSQINPSAVGFIQDYMDAHGKHLTKMKGWGQPYFTLIESILMQYGLPRELKYIAVIESNLSVGATSNKGAGGPWQFMPYTAREYGLVVNGYYDETKRLYQKHPCGSQVPAYIIPAVKRLVAGNGCIQRRAGKGVQRH